MDKKLFTDLSRIINNIKIFDTHEHLVYEPERRIKKIDFFHFFSIYASTDLISSGLKPSDFKKLYDTSIDLYSRWHLFSPFWDSIKNTNYSKVIQIAFKDIYDIDLINYEAVEKITDKMMEFNSIEYYQKIIKNMSKIELILNDLDCMDDNTVSIRNPDKSYFLPVLRLDYILNINSHKKIAELEERNNISINSLSDFIELINKIFYKSNGKVFALKIGMAYFRNILFDNVTFYEAERDFQKILRLKRHDDFFEDCIALSGIKQFQDFMQHYCIRKAIEYNLPIQIHTGLLEGNINDIRNSNPLYLTDLLLMYKNAKFDIFHAGFPYVEELISMAKMYPNTYFNMCWMAGISKTLYMKIMDILIDIVPSSKIFGFGGDYLFVEGTYGAQKIAREALTEVLYRRIKDNYFNFDEAIEFAKKILNLNPKNIYIKN